MSAPIRILFAIAAVSLVASVLRLLAGQFHLPETFASVGIGVVIGAGVALGTLPLVPRKQSATELRRREPARSSKLIAQS